MSLLFISKNILYFDKNWWYMNVPVGILDIALVVENCCIDESIIPYFGRHGAKQLIRGKPIRFGFKLWYLANPTGFLHYAEPYWGSSTRLPETSYGQGGDVGTKLFFDNLFSSVALLDRLASLGYGETGNFSDAKSFAKTSRGTMESKCNNI